MLLGALTRGSYATSTKCNQSRQSSFTHIIVADIRGFKRVVLSARGLVEMDQSELRMKPATWPLRNGGWREPSHKHIRKAEEANFKPKFPYVEWNLMDLWNCWFYCDLGCFLLRRKRFGEWSLVSDRWHGVVCLSIFLKREAKVSNNLTKRRQNGFKIDTRDKFATHLR